MLNYARFIRDGMLYEIPFFYYQIVNGVAYHPVLLFTDIPTYFKYEVWFFDIPTSERVYFTDVPEIRDDLPDYEEGNNIEFSGNLTGGFVISSLNYMMNVNFRRRERNLTHGIGEALGQGLGGSIVIR